MTPTLNLPKRLTFARLLSISAVTVVLAIASNVSAEPFVRPGHKLVGGVWTKPLSQCVWGDVLQVEQIGRDIRFLVEPRDELERLTRGNRAVLIELAGSRYGWQFDMQSRVWKPDRTSAVNFGRLLAISEETAIPGLLEVRAVVVKPEETRIVSQRVESSGALTNVSIVQTRVSVTLSINRPAVQDDQGNVVEPSLSFQASAADFWALTRLEGVRNIREFIAPTLRQLGDRLALTPGPGDVYRAFDDIAPFDSSKQLTDRLLEDLSNPDPRLRQRAFDELRTSANQTVPALLRVDLDALPQDQRLALQRVIDDASRYPSESPADLRANRDFLIECLRYPDRGIRERASRILKAQFQIDVSLDPTDDEIDKLHLKA